MNAAFEQGLRDVIHSSAILTGEIGNYILDSGGKRLRPRLVMLISEALGVDQARTMPLAYTVELLHNASLLHDDVVDGTQIRRSRPTANQVYGDRPALLVGDYVFAAALELTCQLDNMQLALDMINTIKKMTEGELKELENIKAFHTDMDIYNDIIYLKTASLFEFCTYTPAVCVGESEERIAALKAYGRDIGMAFQVVDDIIDLTPGADTNKDAFNDVVEGKSTLPLIYLFEEFDGLKEELSATGDAETRRKLVREKMHVEILERSREQAQAYCDDALRSLEQADCVLDELAAIPPAIINQLAGKF